MLKGRILFGQTSYTIYKIKKTRYSWSMAELFTDTPQNMVFASAGSHLSGISGSKRGVRCLNSFVGYPDSLSG